MPSILIELSIPSEEMKRLYQGTAKAVLTRAEDGRRVQFPAAVLRPYLTRYGVSGRFLLHFDHQSRFIRIEKLPEAFDSSSERL